MAIISTYRSSRESYLTFLNTYPVNGTSLNLNSTGGATTADYTGQYWRPIDGSSNTPTYNDGTSLAELGFVVRFSDIITTSSNPDEIGKVRVAVSLYISERTHWLYLTYKVPNPSSTNTTLGYNYQFKVNGVAYNLTSPITEIINGNMQLPDFDQNVNGTTNYYTFRPSNATATRSYIKDHSTCLWSKILYVTPVNGKAGVKIDVTNLYMHWTNIYSGRRPTIWTGTCSKTFISEKTYTPQSYNLNPSSISISLKPSSATITTVKNGSTISQRNFNNSNTENLVIVDSSNTVINSYRDININHPISITNISPAGTVVSNAAWSSSNNNAIRLTTINSTTSTAAIFNGTISNCRVVCNINGIIRNCAINFTKDNYKSYSSSNTNLATVSSTGKITLNAGTNGSFNLVTTFNGGLVSKTLFNSYLVPNGITMTAYKYGTNTPITSINRGEKASIRAGVTPFNASNSMLSVYTGYRPLTFNLQGSGSISTASAYSVAPLFETVYTAPTNYGSQETLVFTATQSNTNISNSLQLTLNSNEAIPLPNLQIVVRSITPSMVTTNNYCLITYDVIPSTGERALTSDEKTYIDNIPLNFSAEGIKGNIIGSHIDPVTQETVYEYDTETFARVAQSSENTGLTIINPKRQCIFYVEGKCATGYEQPSLTWKSMSDISIIDPYFNTVQNLSDISINSVYLNYITIKPPNIVMFENNIIDVNISFSRNSTTTDIDINYPDNSIMQVISTNITYSQDRLSGSGTIRLKSLKVGYTNLTISSEGMSQTCNIIVVNDTITSRFLYPYVYNKSNNLCFNSIRNSNSELLRLMFKLPPSYVYNALEDIIVSITYTENNQDKTANYSLKTYPELFSAIYPTSNNISSDLAQISTIISNYELAYNDTPYCIFQETDNLLRNPIYQITKFKLEFVLNNSYIESLPSGLYNEVITDNIYNVEAVNTGDNLIGYDNNDNTYSLKGYIAAYKSHTQGYINYVPELVNDYGQQICSLNHFGNKGSLISVEPFYQFLLAENYIRAIDRYLMQKYYNIAASVKSVSSGNIPNSFYPAEIRNMYVTEQQIDKYELRDTQNKILTLPNDVSTVIYDVPTKFPINAYMDYPIMADDKALYYYEDIDKPNTFLNDANSINYTISPLTEFLNTFYKSHLQDTNFYI